MPYDLYSERDGNRVLVASALSLDDAANQVEGMEEAGTWPEGYDAVAVPPGGGQALSYADGWEPL